MKKVTFIKDYANKVKGDEFECDGMLANSLVNKHKVAVYTKDKPKKVATKKTTAKK